MSKLSQTVSSGKSVQCIVHFTEIFAENYIVSFLLPLIFLESSSKSPFAAVFACRVATTCGYLPSELVGKYGMDFIMNDDLAWTAMAQRHSE